MPVVCYRVGAFSVRSEGPAVVVDVATHCAHVLSPSQTNIRDILGLAVGGVEDLGPQGSPFPPHHAFWLRGTTEQEMTALLKAHQNPRLTAIVDGCDLAMCLDFYSVPLGQDEYERTEVGELINRAKYWGDEQARQILASRALNLVRAHPVLRSATAIVPMPSSGVGTAPTQSLARLVSNLVGRDTGIQMARLERVAKVQVEQKNLPDDAHADENQRGTMRGYGENAHRVLVLDDTMRYGSTLKEAARALRAAGAASVVCLCLAKDLKGTKGGYFDE